MVPYGIYKILHLLGILMVFMSLGGLAVHMINGGSAAHKFKKGIAMTHGIGLLFILVGGFGAVARLGLAKQGLPAWVWLKIGIWCVFGALVAVIARKPALAKKLWIGMLVLGVLAAYLAGYKPI